MNKMTELTDVELQSKLDGVHFKMTSRGGARKEMCEVCDGSGRQQDNCLYNCRYCRGTGFDTSLPLKKGSNGIWSKIKTKHSKRMAAD